MTNASIYAAFERFWQHIVALVGQKSDSTLADAKDYTDSKISTTITAVWG
jgi:hypothetical protein